MTKRALAALVAVTAGVFSFAGRDFGNWPQTIVYVVVWGLVVNAVLSFPQQTWRDGMLTFAIWLFVAGVVLVPGGLSVAVLGYLLYELGILHW